MNETRLSKRLQIIQTNIDAIESVLIDIIAGLVPWFAPLLPAYMAYTNMHDILGFDRWLSFAGALVVEFLGLATVQTAVKFTNYNDTARKIDIKKQGQAPTLLAVLMGISYLAIVLSVNVILDYGTEPITHTITKALLSLISIPAAVTIAIRSQHKKREYAIINMVSKYATVQPKMKPTKQVVSQVMQPKTKMSETRRNIYEIKSGNPNATQEEVAQLLEEKTGISISRQAVGKHIRALNGALK